MVWFTDQASGNRTEFYFMSNRFNDNALFGGIIQPWSILPNAMTFAEREDKASRWNFFFEEMKVCFQKKKPWCFVGGDVEHCTLVSNKVIRVKCLSWRENQTNVSSVSPSSEERKKDLLWRRANYLAFPIFPFFPLQSPGFWNPGQFVRLIYSDRMRTVKDKQMVRSCFLRYYKR